MIASDKQSVIRVAISKLKTCHEFDNRVRGSCSCNGSGDRKNEIITTITIVD
jgi:hypothetical protein